MTEILTRRIDVNTYLIGSTIISIFLLINVMRVGIDIFAGYPVVLFNAALLLVLGRLVIHRTHALVIGVLALTSFMASRFSPTPVTSIIAQVAGISVMSVYYFSALLTSGPTVPRWMDLYARVAFYIACFGIVENLLRNILGYGGDERRLKAIFAEPSLFIYTTLPAIGYYINAWRSERRYGTEALIFLLAYALADSALGFLGILLIVAFIYIRRWTISGVLLASLGGAVLLAGLFFVSGNFRIRAVDTAMAVSNMSVAGTNGSTFSLLSNLYVASNAMMDHPLLGVGIGGYGSTYNSYIHELGEEDLKNQLVGLNKDDANSMFLRVLAELGPLGLIALFAFLIVCARVKGNPYRIIRNALLPYMIVRMGRFGAYFSLELYFFVGLYLLNYLEYRRTVQAPAPALPENTRLSPA